MPVSTAHATRPACCSDAATPSAFGDGKFKLGIVTYNIAKDWDLDTIIRNLSTAGIVMGVTGATTDRTSILVAGIAGLSAGALSMAAGEYISMQSQRELFERQIELERAELDGLFAA